MVKKTGFLVAVLLLLSSCGGGGAGATKYISGDECSESIVGEWVCGEVPEGYAAVLECQKFPVAHYWALIEVCKFGCQAGVCTDEAADGGGDIHIQPGDGVGTSDGPTSTDVKFPEVKPEDVFDPNNCDPGKIQCKDDLTVMQCNIYGNGWDDIVCEDGKVCDIGVCVEPQCEPGLKEGICLGPASYSVCSDNGARWVAEYCVAPEMCYEGECKKLICPPGEKICKGMTAVQECTLQANGEWQWVDIDTCQGGVCKDGQCMSFCEVNLKEDSYMGCDYWAVDLDNVEGGEYQPVAVVVSVPMSEEQAAEMTIVDRAAVPPRELTPQELSVDNMLVEPGKVKVFMLPTGHDIDGSILTNKTFSISSTAPVTMHQFNPFNGDNVFTNDASLLLPSNVGGLEFFVMSWPMRTEEFTLRGTATVIATQTGVTKVQLWPTSPVLAGPNVQSMAPNPPSPYEFYMEQGDVLNFETDGMNGADLTGTRIVSDKKVNVFGGHECANIPSSGTDFCDHVEQQLFPVSAWGLHYVGDAFKPRNPSQQDTWRILSGADNVQITLNPAVAGPFTLNRGQVVEFHTKDSFDVKASGPVLMGHFLQGSNYPGFAVSCGTSTGIGDPAFTLGIPVEQYLDEYVVLTPDTYQQDYLNITFKIGTEGQITLDGASLMTYLADASPTPVGNTQWATAQVSVPDGVHTLTSPDNPFGVTAYGYDCDVSYAYPGGLSLKALQN